MARVALEFETGACKVRSDWPICYELSAGNAEPCTCRPSGVLMIALVLAVRRIPDPDYLQPTVTAGMGPSPAQAHATLAEEFRQNVASAEGASARQPWSSGQRDGDQRPLLDLNELPDDASHDAADAEPRRARSRDSA